MRVNVVLVVIALIAGSGVGWWLYQANQSRQAVAPQETNLIEPEVTTSHPVIRQEPPPQVQEPEPLIPENIPEPKSELPQAPDSLGQADAGVAEALADLSPKLLQWFTPKEQIRKWVSLVNNIAAGDIPVKNRPVKIKIDSFSAQQSNGNFYLSPKNYERATDLINALVATDKEQVMRYYLAWKPLLEEAYQELGAEDTFEEKLLQAIEKILNTPVLEEGDIRLKRPLVFYTFADPALEKSSNLEKFLWRLGPENTHKLQLYLEEFPLQFQQANSTPPTTIETPAPSP